MNEKIYELQSPEWERTVMMHLIIKGDAEKVAELVADGWGVYPEILNLLAAFEDTKVLNKVLKAAAAVERYNVERLCGWFKAFFGAGWKKEVVEYRLQRIAAEYFTPEECEENEFWEALKDNCSFTSCEILHKHFDMEWMFNWCNELREASKANPLSDEARSKLEYCEYFLSQQGQFEYLRKNACWKALRYKAGYEYLASIGDYMAIMNCVCVKDDLPDELKVYVRSILDAAEAKMSKDDRAWYKAIRSGLLLKI